MRPIVLTSLLLAAGCSASKEPTYFTLASSPATSRGGAPALIELRRPAVAGHLDRADVVRRVKDYKLDISTNDRWAEPLGDMVGRVLAQDLASRLGESQLFVENGAISSLPDVIVAVNVQTFERGADDDVVLVAQVVLDVPRTRQPVRAKRFELRNKSGGGSTQELVASMSTLLGQLADGVAEMLRQR